MASLEQTAWDNARKPVSKRQKIGRLFQVLQRYPWVQIGRRSINVVRSKIQPNRFVGEIRSSVARIKENPPAAELAKLVISMRSDHPSHCRCDLPAGNFVLLNKQVDLGHTGSFDSDQLLAQTHLWRFQFHYHEFLLTSAALGDWNSISSFLDRWLDQFNPAAVKRNADAWHPYCISRRIVAWLWLLQFTQSSADLDQKLVDRLVASLAMQANWLLQNLERDLGGNHLLENATALAIAGNCLESSDATKWLQVSLSILQQELPKQILSHGEHFELSPVYHCQILSNLLRIETCGLETTTMTNLVRQWITPMLDFLQAIVHPDGEVPLFSDSVFYESPSVAEIVTHAELNKHSLKLVENNSIGDYEIFRNDNFFVIGDFVPIAAPGLPAHGHCDALNLEVSVGPLRWIVDSGNFNYDDDSMRHYCRSSLAHNVVTIEDHNQANIWSKFRMGSGPAVKNHGRVDQRGLSIATASHTGYRKLGVPELTRKITANETAVICVDRHNANKPREMRGHLHLHPSIEVELVTATSTGQCAVFALTRDGIKKYLSVIAETVSVESAWYCPEFGKREKTMAIKYISADFKGFVGWILHKPSKVCEIIITNSGLSINLPDNHQFNWAIDVQPVVPTNV